MTKMTHAKYNELQKKMDQLAGDYVDVMAERESKNLELTSEWLDTHMEEIYKWANTDDEDVLAELKEDYSKLKSMLDLK